MGGHWHRCPLAADTEDVRAYTASVRSNPEGGKGGVEAKKGDLSSRLQDWVSFTSRSHAASLSDLVPDPPCLFLGGKKKKRTPLAGSAAITASGF